VKYNRCFQKLKELPWTLQFQVNNGEVDLERSQANGESFCYSAVNPFNVRLLGHKKDQEGRQFQMSKKRVKSPIRKRGTRPGKNGGTSRCTPEGKKRRRSRLVEPADLHSAGWQNHDKQVVLYCSSYSILVLNGLVHLQCDCIISDSVVLETMVS
jgi:hypothetical protein